MTVELELLLDLHDRVNALRAVMTTHLDALDRDLLHAIIEAKDRQRKSWTRTGVSGCVSPPLEMAPEIAREPDTSSTALSAEQVLRADRGGE